VHSRPPSWIWGKGERGEGKGNGEKRRGREGRKGEGKGGRET